MKFLSSIIFIFFFVSCSLFIKGKKETYNKSFSYTHTDTICAPIINLEKITGNHNYQVITLSSEFKFLDDMSNTYNVGDTICYEIEIKHIRDLNYKIKREKNE